MYMIFNL